MVIGFALFPYLIGGIVMWFVAHMIAPVGYSISLSRGFFAVVLMGFAGHIVGYLSRPYIGGWSDLAQLIVSAAVGMVMLRLPFWRSLLAVFLYTIFYVGSIIAVGVLFGRATSK